MILRSVIIEADLQRSYAAADLIVYACVSVVRPRRSLFVSELDANGPARCCLCGLQELFRPTAVHDSACNVRPKVGCHRLNPAQNSSMFSTRARARARTGQSANDFGYRRRHVLLRRQGFTVNLKRLFRLYREEHLMVRRRGGRKRALGAQAPMLVPQWTNDRWSLDFVADQFIDGRRMRVLAVVDDCIRECLVLVPPLPSSSSAVCGTSWLNETLFRSLPHPRGAPTPGARATITSGLNRGSAG